MCTAEQIGFPTYGEFRPTSFDGHISLDDREHWAVAPVGQNRDSGIPSQSNFAQFLEGLGGESEHVEVHRFGHWANGWFEIIIFDPAHESTSKAAYDMAGALQDYPILNEEDLSERESEDESESWENYGRHDFIGAMRHDVESLGCPRVADFIDDLDCDHIDEIWQTISARANWTAEHSSEGCRFNIAGFVEYITRDHYAEIVRRYR